MEWNFSHLKLRFGDEDRGGFNDSYGGRGDGEDKRGMSAERRRGERSFFFFFF